MLALGPIHSGPPGEPPTSRQGQGRAARLGAQGSNLPEVCKGTGTPFPHSYTRSKSQPGILPELQLLSSLFRPEKRRDVMVHEVMGRETDAPHRVVVVGTRWPNRLATEGQGIKLPPLQPSGVESPAPSPGSAGPRNPHPSRPPVLGPCSFWLAPLGPTLVLPFERGWVWQSRPRPAGRRVGCLHGACDPRDLPAGPRPPPHS